MRSSMFVILAALTCTAIPLVAKALDQSAAESKLERSQDNRELLAQLKTAQQLIAELELKLQTLQAERKSTFPGLRLALADMNCITVDVEDVSLNAIRHGLSKKNIIDAVKARLRTHNIRAMALEELLSSNSRSDLDLALALVWDKPGLHVEIGFIPRGVVYMGTVDVWIGRSRNLDLDDDGGSPEVAKAKSELQEALKAMDLSNGLGMSDEQIAAWDRVRQAEAKVVAALKRVQQDFVDGHPPQKTLKTELVATRWSRQLLLRGALESFAEDERNALDESVDYFAREYLEAHALALALALKQ